MNNIAKPIATVLCTADFRTDRCPAAISCNEHKTVLAACLRCEHARVHHFARGQAADENKEYRTDTTQDVD